MSKASVDLPEPDTPVMTVSRSLGIWTSMLFRLCSRALWMTTESPCFDWAKVACGALAGQPFDGVRPRGPGSGPGPLSDLLSHAARLGVSATPVGVPLERART